MTVWTGLVCFPCVILLLSINRVIPQDDCIFPAYLQNSRKWLYNITQAGYDTRQTRMHYITFEGYTWYGTVGKDTSTEVPYYHYKRECVMSMMDEGKLLIVEIRDGQEDEYMCIEFIQRSPAVVSIMNSARSSQPDTRLCSLLVLDDRPLVRQGGSYFEDCPAVGGFNMKIFDKNWQPKCEDEIHSFQTMRLESGCADSKSSHQTKPMVFNLKNCQSIVNDVFLKAPKSSEDELLCRASWSIGLNTFVILSRNSGLDYWCFKYPKSHRGSFNATIFSDVVCESANSIRESETYAHLSLNEQEVTSFCQDTSPKCSKGRYEDTCTRTVSNNYAIQYCRKRCHDCEIEEKGLPCNFGHANGSYSVLVNKTLQSITLAESAILDPLGEVFCLEESKYSVLKNGEHPIISYKENGCFPRLYCLFVKSLSPSVIGYKLHIGPVWPVYNLGEGSSALFARLCDDSEESNADFEYYAKDWKPAVATSGDLIVRPCDIPGQIFRVETYLHATGDSCVGRLLKPDCTTRQASQIIIDLVSCTNYSQVRTFHFNCLADIPNYDPSGRFRLVKDSISGEYQCLYVPENLSEEGGSITILTLEQCNNVGRYDYILDLRLSRERNNPCQATTPPGGHQVRPTVKGGSKYGDKTSGTVSAKYTGFCIGYLMIWHTLYLFFYSGA